MNGGLGHAKPFAHCIRRMGHCCVQPQVPQREQTIWCVSHGVQMLRGEVHGLRQPPRFPQAMNGANRDGSAAAGAQRNIHQRPRSSLQRFRQLALCLEIFSQLKRQEERQVGVLSTCLLKHGLQKIPMASFFGLHSVGLVAIATDDKRQTPARQGSVWLRVNRALITNTSGQQPSDPVNAGLCAGRARKGSLNLNNAQPANLADRVPQRCPARLDPFIAIQDQIPVGVCQHKGSVSGAAKLPGHARPWHVVHLGPAGPRQSHRAVFGAGIEHMDAIHIERSTVQTALNAAGLVPDDHDPGKCDACNMRCCGRAHRLQHA